MADENEIPGDEAQDASKSMDDDWKAQAQREKEKLAAEAEPPVEDLPPASFFGLVEELSLRTLFALGQVPDPHSGEAYVNLEGGKYLIDTLSVLQEKTKGNLDAEETAYLVDVIQKLQLVFVRTAEEVRSGGLPSSPDVGPGSLGADSLGNPEEGAEGEGAGPRIIV